MDHRIKETVFVQFHKASENGGLPYIHQHGPIFCMPDTIIAVKQ